MDMEKQKSAPIYEALLKYKEENITHFDVPGHKKNTASPLAKAFGDNTVLFDANSTKDLDILSSPDGIIAEASSLLAAAFDADSAFMLVNGSTFGVQAMMMSVLSPKDKIIVPRNVHKSVINGIILSGAVPVFLQPQIDLEYGIANGITVEAVKAAINENPDAKALLVIHPTYFGVCSDLRKIIKICHRRNIAVLVDEAHGAHFPFNPGLPDGAMKLGADISTVSLHKTAGSLTQSSALLHNEGLVNADNVRTAINLMQTTSASYLLLSSIDIARRDLVINGRKRLSGVLKKCYEAKIRLTNINGIKTLTEGYIDEKGIYDYDETKFVIKVNELGLTGFQVYDILKEEYNIQLELAETYVVLAVVSLFDTDEMIDRLVFAFEELSKRYYGKSGVYTTEIKDFFEKPKTIVSPRDAYYSHKTTININDALGQISGESIMIYPPGIPLIIPGEMITKKTISNYNFYVEQNCILMNDDRIGFIKVLGSKE